MDLFSELQQDKGILGEWTRFFSKDELKDLEMIIQHMYNTDVKIYPEREDVLNAFLHSSLDKVGVIVLGQDPYYSGNANGYAFACKNSLSPSLRSIIGGIEKTFGFTAKDFDITLKHWIRDGVLLLNTSLTVEENKPNSHKGVYGFLIDKVIKILNTKDTLVWMLWGGEAQSYSNKINKGHQILTHEHPANAAKQNRNWDCDHFMTANKYLHSKGRNIINWYE